MTQYSIPYALYLLFLEILADDMTQKDYLLGRLTQ